MARKKDEQQSLPGTTKKPTGAIKKAALAYVERRDARMEANKLESEAKVALITLIKNSGETHYADNDLVIDLKTKDNVKVREAGSDDEDEDEAAE